MSSQLIENNRRWTRQDIEKERPLLGRTPAQSWLNRQRAKIKTAPASKARRGRN